MTAHRRKNPVTISPSPDEFEEERIPFDQVLRKLVSAKPVHKSAAGPVKRNAKKPPKKL